MAESANQSGTTGSVMINIGDKIDKYEVVEQIGAGGSSIVWKGQDKLLNRFVAIKQLAPELVEDDESLPERFRREAATQKKLSTDQSHLVQIYDFIDNEQGLFIVMEYVEGKSLETILQDDSRPMEPTKALGIVGATALALDVIHKQGVIHRDLKPSNILLPDEGGLKVCDFGLATLIDEQEAPDAGSVRYMAPELSRSEPGSPRSDIYSLGMIAYELLAGRANFEQAFKIVLRDQRNQALRWMKWHTNERAKATPLSKLVEDIPEALSELVSRMMEKDPATRVADCPELLEAIRRHFAKPSGDEYDAPDDRQPQGENVATSPAAPTAALPTKSKLPYILGAFLLVQLLLFGGYMMMQKNKEASARQAVVDDAFEYFGQAKADYGDGKYGVAKEKFDQLRRDWPNHPTLGEGCLAFSLLCQGRLDLEAGRYTAALASLNEADDMALLGGSYAEDIRRLKREVQSASAFEQQLERIRGLMGDGKFALARQTLLEQRRLTLTAEETKQLDEIAAQLEDQARQQKIDAIIQEAKREAEAGNTAAAIEILDEARARYSSRKITSMLEDLQQRTSYSQAMADANRFESARALSDAIASLRLAQNIERKAEIDQRIKDLQSQIYLDQARQAESEGNTEKAIDLYTKSLGEFENDAAKNALSRLENADQKMRFVRAGDAAVAAREYDTAVKQYNNALQFGPDPEVRAKLVTSQVRLQASRGRLLLDQGKLDEARKALNEAREASPDDSEVLGALRELNTRSEYELLVEEGNRARDKSDFSEAKRLYRAARDIMRTPQVQQLLDDTEYDHLIAQARNHMRSKAWSSARALLRAASSIKVTEELKDLMKEVTENLPRDLNSQ